MDCESTLVQGLRCGVWAWQDFSGTERMLFVDGDASLVSAMGAILPERVDCVSLADSIREDWVKGHPEAFDCILSLAGPEREQDPERALSAWRKLLRPEGKLLLGMNNRFGLRYFCGDRDPYTGRNFDGIEGYQHAYRKAEDAFGGRMYGREEIRELLQRTGWESVHFYAVLPDLENCTLLYDEDTVPKEDLSNRLFPTYHYPGSVFLEERELYEGLTKNGMFHWMANAYLVECSPCGKFSDVRHVTSSMERGREHAFFTLIHRDGRVEKRAAYPEGREKLRQMAMHMERLKARGIPVIEGHMEGERYFMPYVEGENGLVYLVRLMHEDKEKCLRELDRFCGLVLQSSETEKEDAGDGEGVTLRYGYPDMVPWNSLYKDGEFIFFDQEFCVEHCPANMILSRTMGNLEAAALRMQGKGFPKDFFYRRYGLMEQREQWWKMDWKFFREVKKEDELRLYHERCRHDSQTVYTNRQRMNYPAEEYRRLFVNIFEGLEDRKLVLFGSGRYADQFLALYGKMHPVEFVVDNNEKRWGGTVGGRPIRPPEMLREGGGEQYRVIICIKDYLSVLHQLEAMGIRDCGIFDPNRDYPTPRRAARAPEGADAPGREAQEAKKYHVGYIAGVFDLFHIGHLNMFRRAKEQCEYLIVGVVPDVSVRKNKEVEPFIPFEERMEMVRSCRYVDEVVEIPENYGGTRDAWRMYHFDAQFSGSDYIENNDWLAEKEFLEKHGATMVFFPYTEQTSSTKIKALINQRLGSGAKG